MLSLNFDSPSADKWPERFSNRALRLDRGNIKSRPGSIGRPAFPSSVFSEGGEFITCRWKVNAPMSRNGCNLYACLGTGEKKKKKSRYRSVESFETCLR